MKKILVLCISLIAVIGLTASGTWAYFNDVITTADNTFTAGKLSLSGNGIVQTAFAIGGSTKFKPGDKGNAGSATLTNDGNITGDLYFKVSNVENKENTLTSVETKNSDTAPNGELGGLISIAVWFDVGNDGWTENTDSYITSTGTLVKTGSVGTIGTVPDAAYVTADTLLANGVLGTEKLLVEDAAAGTLGTLKVEYYWPKDSNSDHFDVTHADNTAQDDILEFDVNFALVQANE